MWMIVTLLFVGLAIGWFASLLVRGEKHPSDWGMLLSVGVGGSFLGGMIVNLLRGDGIKFRPGGIIASVVGAVVLLAIITAFRNRGDGGGKAMRTETRADGRKRERKGGRKHRGRR